MSRLSSLKKIEADLEEALALLRQSLSKPSMSFKTIDERVSLIESILSGRTRVESVNSLIKKKDGSFEILPCDITKGLKEHGIVNVLGKGSFGIASKVCLPENCQIKFSMKQVIYADDDDYSNYDHPDRPENIEVRCLQLLSQFVLAKRTPHINLYMMDFTCKQEKKPSRYLFSELADGDVWGGILGNLEYEAKRDEPPQGWIVKKSRQDGSKYYANPVTKE